MPQAGRGRGCWSPTATRWCAAARGRRRGRRTSAPAAAPPPARPPRPTAGTRSPRATPRASAALAARPPRARAAADEVRPARPRAASRLLATPRGAAPTGSPTCSSPGRRPRRAARRRALPARRPRARRRARGRRGPHPRRGRPPPASTSTPGRHRGPLPARDARPRRGPARCHRRLRAAARRLRGPRAPRPGGRQPVVAPDAGGDRGVRRRRAPACCAALRERLRADAPRAVLETLQLRRDRAPAAASGGDQAGVGRSSPAPGRAGSRGGGSARRGDVEGAAELGRGVRRGPPARPARRGATDAQRVQTSSETGSSTAADCKGFAEQL